MEVVLETKNLCKSFGAVMVNDKINLTLHRGEIMAVLGENGSGKTTLINMIGGIYYPAVQFIMKIKELKYVHQKMQTGLELELCISILS